MHALYLVSVWLHLLSLAVWAGGMLFLVLVMVPLLRQPGYREQAGRLFHEVGYRFRPVGWVCLGMLVATGSYQLYYRGIGLSVLASAAFWRSSLGHTLGMKLALVALIIGLSAWHDFIVGPRATAAWLADPTSPSAQRLRRRAGRFGRLNLLLALIVAALGVMLFRGLPG